jgi:signal transduction histidine kinase
MTGLVRWWRRRSLRTRITMTAALGLAIALAAAAVLIVNALRLGLTRGLDDQARQAAQQVAALAAEGPLPDPVPGGSGAVTIQVLSASGLITDVSPGADRLDPLLSPGEAALDARSSQARMMSGAPYGMAPLLRVVAVPVAGGGEVIAAIAYSSVSDSVTAMTVILVAGMPLLLILLAAAIWLVTGSLLRPIGELRRGAAAMMLPGSLPVPAARDEVRALADTLNDLLARLARAQQRQRDLVSDTAHELRSPIASMRTQLEVALDHPDLQDWMETARDVHADTLRLATLAEDLLLLARLDERGTAPGSEVTDMAVICRSTAARYGSARVPVCFTGPECLPVLAGAEAVRRIVVNLLDNAVRYAATSVTITASSVDGWAQLTVTDDGPGISPDDRERAFDRFTRLDDARHRSGDDQGGAGLGLAIVRATAEIHGGTATLHPASPGPGLRAVVRLPAPLQQPPISGRPSSSRRGRRHAEEGAESVCTDPPQ